MPTKMSRLVDECRRYNQANAVPFCRHSTATEKTQLLGFMFPEVVQRH